MFSWQYLHFIIQWVGRCGNVVTTSVLLQCYHSVDSMAAIEQIDRSVPEAINSLHSLATMMAALATMTIVATLVILGLCGGPI